MFLPILRCLSLHRRRKEDFSPSDSGGGTLGNYSRVEPYVDCDWRANAERSKAPGKIFERGALGQYKG
jgi:hypothetical protein